MRVAMFQMDVKWEDAAHNCCLVKRWIGELGDKAVDLVVLPEMFATGFSMSPGRMAQKVEDSSTVDFLCELAVKHNLAIITSIAVEAPCSRFSNDRAYFNRLYFFTPDGLYLTYDKRHTFSLSGEDMRYGRGASRTIIHYRGFRICPLVCYDLRFPVYSRNRGDYDMLVYVASWPDKRIKAWDRLLPARAIENQCFVVGVNRVGEDPGNVYSGHSVVLDYVGDVVGRADDYVAQTVVVDLEKEKLDTFRSDFPFYKDADKFEIVWN